MSRGGMTNCTSYNGKLLTKCFYLSTKDEIVGAEVLRTLNQVLSVLFKDSVLFNQTLGVFV